MPGFIGIPELLILGLVILLVFGPKRLPEIARSLGKGMRELKSSIGGDHHDDGIRPELLAVPTEHEAVSDRFDRDAVPVDADRRAARGAGSLADEDTGDKAVADLVA